MIFIIIFNKSCEVFATPQILVAFPKVLFDTCDEKRSSMKYLVLFIILSQFAFSQIIGANQSFLTPNRFRFYSPRAQEAQLVFKFTVELNKKTQPSETEFKTAIDKQLTFLFGAFSSQYRQAVPKSDYQFQITKAYQVNPTTWRADYNYSGLVLISQGENTYNFLLPINPYIVWNKSVVNSSSSPYPCTDPSHAVEQYFWYFFNPKAYGCPLKENVDYFNVQGTLQYYQNTKASYPEYERLFVNGELTFHILFGMDDSSQDWNPKSSKDLSAQSYRQLKQALVQWGYQSKVWSKAEISSFFGNLGYFSTQPYVEELVKQTPKGIVRYRIFFGASTIYEGLAFQKFLSYSLKSSSIMLYAGHSGLGEYLNLDLMQNNAQLKMTADQNRYQIYYFNSCSSYPYYNSQYFNLKRTAADPKGTKNLDIITNGLSTLFLSIAPSSFTLMQAVELYSTQGKKVSYQDMMNSADSNNLIGVNGDEDNAPAR